MKKVFIDGSSGTTGLKIRERLADRKDIGLITLPEERRHDLEARREAAAESDLTFLCLPDAAAAEIAEIIPKDTVVIDTSTAHRVQQGWTYGLPELPGQRERIGHAKRIANPGCHATGFIVLTAPLIAAGILKKDARLSCTSLTGYSGGGKKMIAQYESDGRDALLDAPRMYGLTQNHKHLPEMAKVCGLTTSPVFCPVVADYLVGMEVVVSVFADQVAGGVQAIREAYKTAYDPSLGGVVSFVETADEEGFLAANAWADCDTMQVTVEGNDERILLVSRFDNLGKGASGAAIQNMNIVLGLPETAGLVIR